MKLRKSLCLIAFAVAAQACGDDSSGSAGAGGAGGSDACFDSTFALIQEQIFDAKGCTNASCHGAPASEAQAGLDLRPESAFDSLVNVQAGSGDYVRVFPNDEEESVLYLKVRAKTVENDLAELGISGGPMPSGAPALTTDELELIRLWIRGGARQTGVVAGTEKLIGCDGQASIDPNKIDPPPVPDVNAGVQFYSGGWDLPAESENEVCFVTYYDYSEIVPAEQQIPCDGTHGGPDRMCFTYNDILLAQDSQSHHSIVEKYIPPADKPEQWDPTNEVWKDWACVGGPNAGMACTPGGSECGERSNCATGVVTSIACTLYPNGPNEMGSVAGFFGNSTARLNIASAQEASFREDFVDGVYSYMPVKGFIIWDSHAFNLTDKDTELEQWVNMEFAQPSDRVYPRRQIFDANEIFEMGVIPAFETREVCGSYRIPQHARLLTLSTHTHRYGKRFRIWYPPNEFCEISDADCTPPDREADYESRLYDDPLYQRFGDTGPLVFDSPNNDDRTFRYCSLYDNGATDPFEVKRESMKPDANTCDVVDFARQVIPPEVGFTLTQCGCPEDERRCLGGDNQGTLCNGDDSACGEGGVCDACPTGPGVTTEDEMFLLLGSYYVQEP